MASTEKMVLVESTKLLTLFGIFFAIALFLLIVICCLDHQVSKLRRENKLLRRVLEDYYRLEDGRIRASRAMAREAERSGWLPSGW